LQKKRLPRHLDHYVVSLVANNIITISNTPVIIGGGNSCPQPRLAAPVVRYL
jgi:hypothetical protein